MAPTYDSDPAKGRAYTRQWLKTQAPETLPESDWRGLLIGLGVAIGSIGALILLIRFFLGVPQ